MSRGASITGGWRTDPPSLSPPRCTLAPLVTSQCLRLALAPSSNRMTGTSVARVSDDFYPRDPASSSAHLAACIFNSLFMSVLVQPDWDMFHSKHAAAQLHAMARWATKAAKRGAALPFCWRF